MSWIKISGDINSCGHFCSVQSVNGLGRMDRKYHSGDWKIAKRFRPYHAIASPKILARLVFQLGHYTPRLFSQGLYSTIMKWAILEQIEPFSDWSISLNLSVICMNTYLLQISERISASEERTTQILSNLEVFQFLTNQIQECRDNSTQHLLSLNASTSEVYQQAVSANQVCTRT